MNLAIPTKLKPGDKVATVSLSWGGAGDEDLRFRYDIGKKVLQDEFDLEVVEMDNTLKGTEYLYKHPEERAKDLMDAFKDTSIKAIFSNIGGDDTVRLLPYIDYDVIKNNPKIFVGYSDTTVNHFMCLKANVRSYYGPAVLSEFAENKGMYEYTKESLYKTLFTTEKIGELRPSKHWTSERLEWKKENQQTLRRVTNNKGTIFLQGKGQTKGHLIGGCMDVLEMIKGTSLWPDLQAFDGAILFFETSEDKPEPDYIKYWLRNYGAMGILDKVNGIIFGKPYDEKYFAEYQEVILQVVKEEYKIKDIPIVYNLNFGHTAPMFTIPYGAIMTIDAEEKTLSIDEPGVNS